MRPVPDNPDEIPFDDDEEIIERRFDPAAFLGPSGPIAARMNSYEVRDEQIEMTRAVARAFLGNHHLVVEAGTGVGKSFAYLAAALSRLDAGDNCKIVISTHTIALQEQLLKKDIPFVKNVSGHPFVAVLVKGRGNYLCRRRLETAIRSGPDLFDTTGSAEMLDNILRWARETPDGSLSALGFRPPRDIWESICCENGSCTGRQCKYFEECFYQLARRRMFGADILVANHALLFSDLALRQQNAKLLPRYDYIILDEAHNTEQVAGDHFGLRLNNTQVQYMLNRLYNSKTHKGLLARHHAGETLDLIDQVYHASEAFYDEVVQFNDSRELSGQNTRISEPDQFANVLSMPLMRLGEHLNMLAKDAEDEAFKLELGSYVERCGLFAGAVNDFIRLGFEEYVYWTEASKRRWGHFASICASPLDVGPLLQEALFKPMKAVIMTSATLSIKTRHDKKDKTTNGERENPSKITGFEFFAHRIGLEQYQPLLLGSPFDYRNQTRVLIESYLPEQKPGDDSFLDQAIEAVEKYLTITHGKAFLLFTSFGQLRVFARRLEPFCRDRHITLLEHSHTVDRTQLLEQFKNDTDSILLGTDSFWQGVDVPGQSLSCVIIVKLPFAVPDHPLLQARLEKIRTDGGNPFMEYQVPEAIIKFKQGFGRLIRSRTDKGIVVVLDPRIIKKHYGHAFLEALPDCPIQIVHSADDEI